MLKALVKIICTSLLLCIQHHAYALQNTKPRPIKHTIHVEDQQQLSSFALTPDNKQLYALSTNPSAITVLDYPSGNKIKTIYIKPTSRFNDLKYVVFNAKQNKAYVVDSEKNVYVINTETLELTGKVAGKPETDTVVAGSAVAIDPQGHKLYVADYFSQKMHVAQLHVIDTDTDQVIQQLDKPLNKNDDTTFGWLEGKALLSHDASKLYISSSLTPKIDIFDTNAKKFLQPLQTKADDGLIDMLIVDNKMLGISIGSLFEINLETGATEAKGEGSYYWHLNYAKKMHKIYVTEGENMTMALQILDDKDYHVIARLPLGKYPDALQLTNDENELLVGLDGDHAIAVLDVKTDTIIRMIHI